MGNPTICMGENKGADQLRSNCQADQRLCFLYTDGTIPQLSKSKISSLYPSSVTEPGLCWTWSEPKLLVFSHTGSYNNVLYKKSEHQRSRERSPDDCLLNINFAERYSGEFPNKSHS